MSKIDGTNEIERPVGAIPAMTPRIGQVSRPAGPGVAAALARPSRLRLAAAGVSR